MKHRTRPRRDAARRDAPSAEPARRKGSLFCPGCAHASHVDGDWIPVESTSRTGYACPDCGAVVVSQPTFRRAGGT